MPTLMLRGLDAETSARVKSYARTHDLSVSAAAAQLLTIALDHLEARKVAGEARWTGLRKAERSEVARRAAQARWDREREQQ